MLSINHPENSSFYVYSYIKEGEVRKEKENKCRYEKEGEVKGRGRKKGKERRGKLSGMHMVFNSLFVKFFQRLQLLN